MASNAGGFIDGVNLKNFLIVDPQGRNSAFTDSMKRIGLEEKQFIRRAKADLLFIKFAAEHNGIITKIDSAAMSYELSPEVSCVFSLTVVE